MAMTDREKSEAYRNRMYAAGFKQTRIWVPRESEGKIEKMERKKFLGQLELLTAGWSQKKLSKFFAGVLKIVKQKLKEEEK